GTIALDEVVAIGYETIKKSDLTGAVSSINADDIAQSQSINFLNAMQGRMSGVNITSESGEPGSGFNIQVREANSINGSSSPLFIIDGIQLELNTSEVASSGTASTSTMDPLASINPS